MTAASYPALDYPALAQPFTPTDSDAALPASADVVIIGSGVIGICAALELAAQGLQVAVLEKGLIAAEQSSRNWGWVRQQGRDRRELPLIVHSLARWEQLQHSTGSDLGFRRTGLLSLTRDAKELARWQRWAVRGRAAGIEVQELDAAAAEALLPSIAAPWLGGIATPDDARAEPGVAVPALAAAARRAGVSLHQHTAARTLLLEQGAVAGVITEHGTIRSHSVLLAAGAWSSLFLRQHGVRLPQLTVRATVARTSACAAIVAGTFCSTDFCLRRRLDDGFTLTLREDEIFDLEPDSFRFLGDFAPLLWRNWRQIKLRAGLGHFVSSWRRQRTRTPQQRSAFEIERIYNPAPDTTVADRALQRLKHGRAQMAETTLAASWAGRIDLTPDLVPVISPVASLPGLVLATGFSGHGFGIGPGAGRLAADLLRGAPPVVDPAPFRLSRFSDGSPLFIDPDVI
ncbi:NAD(P)/FAD-dependent oxidoreductase [Vogesella indigofera]|uniref:NAD(P)/FAD-dependent oxidoreductase n=1 Tax=Vogesella indigofera TaxID=45465 RepID=UPI00234F31A2|nr:FAD-binding oxidoreductase [Vogesella indigofera]MDC7700785.1 FAD-binding oxidoreductase [Vogesella indigofera]